ncbi:MAG: UvrD-helicase domain-containing protein [Luteolibacter sp.]
MNITEKNLLILASAGSGKTFRLSDRIIDLVAGDIDPEKIVALTFTRKAAGEFADAILTKLAEAAKNEASPSDSTLLLEKIVRQLPRLTLGTMDGFFARIVKGFQYELGITGGRFDLLEGEVAETAQDEILESLLNGELASEDEFVTTFRRATAGKEGTRVLEELRDFIQTWHLEFLSSTSKDWGTASLSGVEITDWEKLKAPLIEQVRRDWPNIPDKKKRHETAFEPMLTAFQNHTIGSGLLEKATGLTPKILEACAISTGSISISYYQPLEITGLAAQALRQLVELAARCELAAALSRTRGIHSVIATYDSQVEKQLRSRGKLGFDDVKRLMGEWMKNEDARLRREAVDFRLDANYSHWLLDEFQDTSRDEWNGLLPLIDEAITDDGESTTFIVGDKKQAIYAWRGGEVALFDELIENYAGGLKTETMAESWRSCPEVLSLVNQVCGDIPNMETLFGEATGKWQWEDHFSAAPLTSKEKAGYARVEVVDEKETTRQEHVIALLKDLGIGRKNISCGILVETNNRVGEWADALRNEGYEVVEEGARQPGKDHPVGIMIWQLLRWLADPSDSFARQTVMMSPLKNVLEERHGTAWQSSWETLGTMVSEKGFAGMLADLISPLRKTWTPFGQRRAADLLQALEDLDQKGTVTARDAADWIERMKISQSPGVAAIQIMTVHKSKGLGFDVVILPDVPTKKIPDLKHYKTVSTKEWITSAPTTWARNMIPELREAEQTWAAQQTYEAFCKLYVALTRAKRGIYVFLETPSKSSPPDKASLSNWLMTSLPIDPKENTAYEIGNPQWATAIEEQKKKQSHPAPSLGNPVPKRSRSTPSTAKHTSRPTRPGSGEGRRFGTAVHTAFEKIGWLDEEAAPPFLPQIQSTMDNALAAPEIKDLLSRNGKAITLHREQRIEAVIDEKWISGVIDRLHVSEDLVEIIDFKTDKVASTEELTETYQSQMQAYAKTIGKIYPDQTVRCTLVSTALGKAITL